MGNEKFELSFQDCAESEATVLAQGLEEHLREAKLNVQVELKKGRSGTQDFGSTLVLILGTPVAIALAQGVAAFLLRNSGARIRIARSGEVIAENLNSEDAAKIAEVLSRKSA
jgi:hypothetical protein